MGKVAWKTPKKPNIKYIETYHPAAAMRFPNIREKFEEDLDGTNWMTLKRHYYPQWKKSRQK